MTKKEILSEVTKIFIDVLDNNHMVLTWDTTAQDVNDWDSLNHIQLVVAIEKKFQLKFTTAEIRSWKNVGEMCESIFKRLH